MATERLQKVLAAAGVASRRASEVLIANGRVTVDGKPAKLGMQVDPAKAVIAVDGEVIGAASAPEYLMLHKPGGVTSTVRDRHASKTVLDMIPTAMLPEGGRLYPVGRLDQDSEGLLVLTNDGAWADRVLHPRHGIEREYAIGLRAPLSPDQVKAIKAGIPLDEGLATLTGLRATTEIETRRLDRADLAAARQPDLVSRDPGPGLEAPVAPDVRGRRRPDRPPGPRPDGSGSPRRPAERSRAPASGAGGPRPGRRGRCQQGRGEDGTVQRRVAEPAARPAAVNEPRQLREGALLWQPSEAFKAASTMTDYMDWLERERGLRFADYAALWRWSVDDLAGFWSSVVDYYEIPLRGAWTEVLGDATMPGARWFDGAQLNYAEALLRRVVPDRPALLFASERSPLREVSGAELAGCGGGGRRGVAPARRRAWRSRRRDGPEHPRGGRRIAGVREPRGDLVELLAGLRRARSHRSLRADLAEGADRRRWLHLRRQAVRSPRGRRRAPRGAADPGADGPDPVSRPWRDGRRPRRDVVGRPARRAGGAADLRTRAVRPPAVGPLLVGHDRAAEGDRPWPRRRRARAREGDRPDVRHPRRRPDVLVHDDRLDDVELPGRLDAGRRRPGPLRRQPRLPEPRRRCGTSRRAPG